MSVNPRIDISVAHQPKRGGKDASSMYIVTVKGDPELIAQLDLEIRDLFLKKKQSLFTTPQKEPSLKEYKIIEDRDAVVRLQDIERLASSIRMPKAPQQPPLEQAILPAAPARTEPLQKGLSPSGSLHSAAPARTEPLEKGLSPSGSLHSAVADSFKDLSEDVKRRNSVFKGVWSGFKTFLAQEDSFKAADFAEKLKQLQGYSPPSQKLQLLIKDLETSTDVDLRKKMALFLEVLEIFITQYPVEEVLASKDVEKMIELVNKYKNDLPLRNRLFGGLPKALTKLKYASEM